MEQFSEKEKQLIADLEKLKQIEPDYDFIQMFRVSLMEKSEKEETVPITESLFRHFQRGFAFGGVALLALSLLGGVAWASQKSLPDNFLYPVKIAAEKAKLAVASNNFQRAQLRVKFAETRLSEIGAIHRRDSVDPKVAVLTLKRFESEIESIHKELDRAPKDPASPELLKSLLGIEDKISGGTRTLDEITAKLAGATTSKEIEDAFLKAKTATELGLERTTEKIFSLELQSQKTDVGQDTKQKERLQRTLEKLENRLTSLDEKFSGHLASQSALAEQDPTIAPETILPPLTSSDQEILGELEKSKELIESVKQTIAGQDHYLQAVENLQILRDIIASLEAKLEE